MVRKSPTSQLRFQHRSLAIAALGTGALLMMTSWWNHRAVETMLETLQATQSDPELVEALAVRSWWMLGSSLLAATVLLYSAVVSWRRSHEDAGVADQAPATENPPETAERERQLHAVGEMSAVLAHEIRNPVTSLKGHAQLLVERLPADGRERSKAERIVSEAVRLEVLSADLLDFCKTGPLERRPIDPAKLLRDAAQAVDSERVEVKTEGCPKTWSLDPFKMRQLLVNILRNACQASTRGQTVEAQVHVDSDRLLFTVRDAGDGIAAGSEEQIFEPFFTTRAKGTGLGLGVARRIAEMHGGTVTAGNRAEGGARFETSIPDA